MNRTIIISFLFLLFMSNASIAQYFGERVMEKSFEQTDFFFTPYRLVPYGIGTFKSSVSGVVDDPLLNLDLNPAYFYRDSLRSSYIYFDFRTAREIRDTRNFYFPYPMLAVNSADARSILPYPRFYVNTRRELEPVLSAAYLLHPPAGIFRNLSLGLTYQLVSQDEKYYPIPEDIYKNVLGANYLGDRSTAASNIPIVDKYSGTDNIHQEGHFVSFFAGYDINRSLQVGAKLGRVNFNREGSYGSQNMWDNYFSSSNSSLWRNGEARNQSYAHWELIGGVNYELEPRYSVGLSVGHLWGNADQVLTRSDSSYWSYGHIGSAIENWNLYSSFGDQRQSWNHDGKTSLASVNLKAEVSSTQLLQFHYQYARQNTDIALNGNIMDSSYGMSRYQWDTTSYKYTSNYGLLDRRNGTGATTGDIHRAVGSLQWDLSADMKLSLGLQYESRTIETSTSEAVFANRHSLSSSTGSYPYSYFDSTAESKTLEWAFRSKLTTFTIPVFFSIRTSKVIELVFGLNRSTSTWQVDDMTLALYNYRVQANAQDTVRGGNFGERYTQPQEKVSEIRTTLLAGLTVSPSDAFNVRLLVVPNYVDTYDGTELSDLQWWITLNILP